MLLSVNTVGPQHAADAPKYQAWHALSGRRCLSGCPLGTQPGNKSCVLKLQQQRVRQLLLWVLNNETVEVVDEVVAPETLEPP